MINLHVQRKCGELGKLAHIVPLSVFHDYDLPSQCEGGSLVEFSISLKD